MVIYQPKILSKSCSPRRVPKVSRLSKRPTTSTTRAAKQERLPAIPIGDIMIQIPNISKDQIIPEKTRQEAWDRRQSAFARAQAQQDPYIRYRDIFENCCIRYRMSLGLVGALVSSPILHKYQEGSARAAAVGHRERIKARLDAAQEVFDMYLNGGLASIENTAYFATYTKGTPAYKVRARIEAAGGVLRRMKDAGKFVGSAGTDKYYPSDFPQVIDYWGYKKNLDGTHRRMIMHYLGHTSVPSLLVTAADLRLQDLPQGYIRNGWSWFANELRWRLGVPISQEDKATEVESLGAWYQCIDVGTGRLIHSGASPLITGRTEDMLPYLMKELRSDDEVLDIGCNAGLYTVLSAAKCRRATGVDVAERFVRQAYWVRRQWETVHGRSLTNAHFLVADIQENLGMLDGCTVLLIPKIFHHKKFNHKKINEFMQRVAQGRTRVVLLQGHKQRGERGRERYLINILQKYGFFVRVAIREEANDFPLVIGRRKHG